MNIQDMTNAIAVGKDSFKVTNPRTGEVRYIMALSEEDAGNKFKGWTVEPVRLSEFFQGRSDTGFPIELK